jgi:hypothetical protein
MDIKNFIFSDESLFVLNKDFQITQYHLASKTQLALNEQSLLQTDILNCIIEPDNATFKKHLQEVISTGKVAEFSAMACDQKSKSAMYQWKISLHGPEEIYVLGRELTLEKFERSTVHEINNPLTVIQTRSFQLQQMAESNEVSADKVKYFADSIYTAATKISMILKSTRK